MNSIIIEMEYIPTLSVNSYKTVRGITRREVVEWMGDLGWLIKSAHIEDWELPLIVQCSGQFKDKRSQPDLSNLSKVVLDAIEETTGVNDRDMRWRDGTVTYGEPLLWITIAEPTKADWIDMATVKIEEGDIIKDE